ncbi:glycosyltransferase family 22 protein [Irpex lacteus]|nr:glycosyltransferase family 22 protein [Irpex lacteus]
MATPLPGTQTIRFRRPTNQANANGGASSTPSSVITRKNRHAGILQDQLRRSQRAPWCPSFSLAFRIFVLIRVTGAMYVGLNDCDEVFNFWEPLHYLHRGHAFQTWETSPEFSIRSWAYVLLHLWPGKLANFMFGPEKRPAFFAIRIFLAFISATSEAFFYRTVVDKINYRAGRYLLFMMLFNAGMWNASVAFLPSSFAMYLNAIGFAYFIEPTTSINFRRTLLATLAFATGALVGWPFSIAVALPFVFEELFLFGKDTVSPKSVFSWRLKRFSRLVQCGLVAALLLLPVVAIDTLFYGKLTIVPWNIVKYNVFSSHGPNLYGTEPLSYYINNLVLNMNVIIPLAFFSLPALLITHRIDRRRLGDRAGPERSSPYTLLAVRLAPMYVWFAIFFAQPHKEERFMFPVYPLICFNAAVCLYLVRGWMEVAFVTLTKSPYRAAQSVIFSRFTLSVVTATSVISISRGIALYKYYHAPMALTNYFEAYEIPRILNSTGYVNLPPPLPAGQLPTSDADNSEIRLDYDLINPFNLTLCYGKEWHRFPGSYLVPDGVSVEWVKSEFDGMLPGHFKRTPREGGLASRIHGTRVVPYGLNDLNKEEPSFYVDVNTCDYLVDLDFPSHHTSTPLEPRYAVDEAWDRVKCEPFLDARHSSLLTRTVWMPGERWRSLNEFGDYCLLKNKRNMERKERVLAVKA